MVLNTIIIIIFVTPCLLYLFCKLYEYYAVTVFKKINTTKDIPTVIPTKSIFNLAVKIIQSIISKSKATKAGYLIRWEEYQKKPLKEQVGIEHEFLLHKSSVVLYDYEAISKVLLDSKTFPKAPIFKTGKKKAENREEFETREKSLFGLPNGSFAGRFFGQFGLAFLTGDEHRRLRQLLEPAFMNIDRFVPVLKKKTDECLDLWEEEMDKNNKEGVLKLVPYFPRLTLDMLGLCIFGHDFNSLNNSKEDPYIESYHYVMNRIGDIKRLVFGWYNRLPIKENYEMEYHINNLNKMTFDLIEKSKEKIKKWNENNYRSNEEDFSLLDRMVETTLNSSEEDKLALEEIRDNVILFFVAGHETTATMLGSAMYCLAKHQEVQERLFDEINQCKKDSTTTSWSDLVTELPYLKAFINEVLRLYPPAPQISPKQVSVDTTLCGYKIPKGTIVNVNIVAAHRGNHWGDPLVFRPERWLEENKSELPPMMSYVPFGGGRHICIGNKFSLCEQQVFLFKLLKRFHLYFPEKEMYKDFPYREGSSIFIAVDDKLQIKLTKRN